MGPSPKFLDDLPVLSTCSYPSNSLRVPVGSIPTWLPPRFARISDGCYLKTFEYRLRPELVVFPRALGAKASSGALCPQWKTL